MATGALSAPSDARSRRVNVSIWTFVAFIVVDLLLVAACLFALRQNVKLRGEMADYAALLTPRTGAVLPPLVGQDWTGTPQTIAYGQDRRLTLVYTFTKGCPYCRENWRAMRPFQALAPQSLRIVYIDTVRDLFTAEYLAANDMGKSVLLVELSSSAAFAYEARIVPQLVLVGPDGRVQWSHAGQLAPGDIFKALSFIEQP